MMKYTPDHEWLRVDGDIATVGISPFAQEKLGDLVFVELPNVGAKLAKGAPASTVEIGEGCLRCLRARRRGDRRGQ